MCLCEDLSENERKIKERKKQKEIKSKFKVNKLSFYVVVNLFYFIHKDYIV